MGVMLEEMNRMAMSWTDAEESTIAQIMADEGCSRMEAIRTMRQEKNCYPVSAFGVFPDCGFEAVSESLQRKARGEVLPMNVSREADASYCQAKGILQGGESYEAWVVGTCTRCGHDILNAPFRSRAEAGDFCSATCRDGVKRARRKAGRPKGATDRSYIRRSNKVHASSAHRQRAYRERQKQFSATPSVTEYMVAAH
jgi:hypothetical protein